jgi:hypothetical protein
LQVVQFFELLPMKRWQWALLIFELALIAVILILPQVNLPDSAFHRGTAPTTLKSSVTSAPVFSAVSAHIQLWLLGDRTGTPVEIAEDIVPAHTDSRLSLLCMLIC